LPLPSDHYKPLSYDEEFRHWVFTRLTPLEVVFLNIKYMGELKGSGSSWVNPEFYLQKNIP
jgi:hypothetical protein